MLRAKIVVENNGGKPVSYETLQIRAEVKDQNYEGKSIAAGCDLPLVYSTYKGWTLTEDGQLMQGQTGWFFDEKDYYILKDGRRVDEDIMTANKYKEQDLKIGNDDPVEGWKTILGMTSDSAQRIELEYNAATLLNIRGPFMTEVVYQAFQTNKGYELLKTGTVFDKPAVWENHRRSTPQSRLPEPFSFGDYSFGTIGEDETGIPIMVTRVGNENAQRKLVIAGPHGDERNAQRLIMTIQKYFLQHGSPRDTVIYFVPCLSPTMCFSDTRGIPNIFWKNGVENGKYEQQLSRLSDGKFKLGSNLTIPALHNEFDIRQINSIDNKPTLIRDLIQSQGNPSAPMWGVDANRDITLSLPSNLAFNAFINDIKSQLPSVYTETQVNIYDPADQTETSSPRKTINNFRVLMIHGYDDTQPDGCVYGPYSVKRTSQLWPARMSTADKTYVNRIREKLGWGTLEHYDRELGKEDLDNNGRIKIPRYLFFYLDTAQNAKPYEGEWSWHLYANKIWPADIELLRYYDEGVRGSISTDNNPRPYENQLDKIGEFSLIFNNFCTLLNNFPWEIGT